MNLSEYEDSLIKTIKKYSFLKINGDIDGNVNSKINDGEKVFFLRHDIDFSPENALRIAEIENKYGVQSTYTILLTGEFYNPFEKVNRFYWEKIIELGHEVGLHFDPSVYVIDSEPELDEAVEQEKLILEKLLKFRVGMFSFHNTTPFSMMCKKKSYGGFINSYSNFFQKQVEYTSDSNGYWRFRSWDQLLNEEHDIIQVLTHPVWWKPSNILPLPFEEPLFQIVLKGLREKFNCIRHIFLIKMIV